MTSDPSIPKRLPLPDLADIVFLLILQLVLFLKPDFVFGDGSTGWHLVSGNFILDQHAIPHTDLFSYTFPGKPWVAYEWLSDLLMAATVKLGGLNLLAVTVSSAIALLFALLYLQCRKNNCHFFLSVFLCVVGAIVSSVHWLARPVLFVFFGVYLFATTLESYWRGAISGRRMMITLALTMVVWVNTHPGFLIGLAMLSIYLGSAILQAIFGDPKRLFHHGAPSATEKAITLGLALLVLLATTLCNPYFFHLYSYIRDYLNTGAVLAATDEFTSPIFHGDLQPLCLELLFGIFMIGLAITRRPLSLPYFLLSLAFCHLSLSGKRNMPLVVIVLLPAIAQLLSRTRFDPATPEDTDARPAFPFRDQLTALLSKMRKLDGEFTENERLCNMHILPWAAFVILCVASISGGRLMGIDVIHSTFDHEHKPTKTLTAITDLKLDPKHGFNLDNWGGYIRYEANIPVFIDDRADFYGEKFYFDYAHIVGVVPGWADVLKKYDINWVLFPKNSNLALALKENPNWKLAAEDNAACLYIRNTQVSTSPTKGQPPSHHESAH
jgi:hypothetical protein